MADNNVQSKINSILGLYETGLNRIAGWNKLVPDMQRAKEHFSWMSVSINQSPPGLNAVTDEGLMDYLHYSEQAIIGLSNIPEPPKNFRSIINITGSASASAYQQFVDNAAWQFHDQPQVVEWARQTTIASQALRTAQNRSDEVQKRLVLLDAKLSQLHQQAGEATLSSSAGVVGAIEAAAIQRRLLEQFKGALINRCKTGAGVKYTRISENLAVEADITKMVVAGGQITYDALHSELTEISKSIRVVNGERMGQLLRQLEDHIWVITDALDSDKTGVTFSNA